MSTLAVPGRPTPFTFISKVSKARRSAMTFGSVKVPLDLCELSH